METTDPSPYKTELLELLNETASSLLASLGSVLANRYSSRLLNGKLKNPQPECTATEEYSG